MTRKPSSESPRHRWARWQERLVRHGAHLTLRVPTRTTGFSNAEHFYLEARDETGGTRLIRIDQRPVAAEPDDLKKALVKELGRSDFKRCPGCRKVGFAYAFDRFFDRCRQCAKPLLAAHRRRARRELELSVQRAAARQAREGPALPAYLRSLKYKAPKALSTRTLERWPRPEAFAKLAQSLAVLDLCEGGERYRYECFETFDRAHFFDGEGNEATFFFAKGKALLLGFQHESAMSSWATDDTEPWPGVFDGLPRYFSGAFFDQHVKGRDVSFCAWWIGVATGWRQSPTSSPPRGRDPDGSEYILEKFPFDPRGYVASASYLWTRRIPLEPVERIYAHEPLTDALIRALAPECTLRARDRRFRETGYPTSASARDPRLR